MDAGTVAAGFGFTVIVYVLAIPRQPFKVGVTVIVPDILDVPVLVAVKEGTLPVPLAASPIAVLLFVHAKVAPEGVLLKLPKGTVLLWQ